jgi:hypothetical protein
MLIIQANPGEWVYNFLSRALKELVESNYSTAKATQYSTTITIYRKSYVEDLCDKWDMQRKIDILHGDYKG